MNMELWAACLATLLLGFGSGWAAEPGYMHAPDYTLLQGKLLWNGVEGGHWQISYLDPRTAGQDRYGGRFTLGTPKELAGFKAGEWVKVRGRVKEDMATIWMSGTFYELKSVERLGAAPEPQRLSEQEARYVAAFRQLDEAGLRHPRDFAPAKEFLEVHDQEKRLHRMFFVMQEPARAGERTVYRPVLLEDAGRARQQVEQHIRGKSGNYLGAFEQREAERIVAEQSSDCYHRFDTRCVVRDGSEYRICYLVLKPGFLEQVPERENAWLSGGGKGLVAGPVLRERPASFGAAADLLVFLFSRDGGGVAGALVEREVLAEGPMLTWRGVYVVPAQAPDSGREWDFRRLTVTVERAGGRVTLEQGPLGAPPQK